MVMRDLASFFTPWEECHDDARIITEPARLEGELAILDAFVAR
jgi:hypothetical protein